MKKYFLLLFIPIVVFSCRNNSEAEKITTGNAKKIESLHWLLGTWENYSGEEYAQESWSKEGDKTFSAYSFVEQKGEIVFAETMALEQRRDNLFLTVAQAGENQENAVTFKLISSANGTFIFENKEHDFPQRIVYTNPAQDSLHAWIEGTENGIPKKIDFNFSRKN